MADTHYNLTHQNGNVAHVEKATWRQTQRPSLYLLWARRQTLHQFGQQQSILSLFLPLALSIYLCSLNFEKTRLHMTMQLKFPSRTYIPDISDYSIQPVARRCVSKSQSDGWLRIAWNRAMATFFFFFFCPFPLHLQSGTRIPAESGPPLTYQHAQNQALNPNTVSQFHMQTHCYSF